MTGEENTKETEETLSRKFTIKPGVNSYLADGTENPVMAARMKMLNPVEMEVQTVQPFDPANSAPRMPCVIQDGATPASVASVITSIGRLATATPNGVATFSCTMLGRNAGGMETLRTPEVFNHVLCTTSAATVVWDPAAGKKFRLMGYVIVPAAGMAAAGIQLITLLDEATAMTIAHQIYLPAAANVANQPPIVVKLPGNGYLSTTVDNRLSVTLTSACTAGAISVMTYGTEE